MSEKVELLLNHLEIWTSAMKRKNGAGRGNSANRSLFGIEYLRHLIFDLAVSGKLVPQSKSDGDSTDLIKGFARTKRKLIKEKRIRNQKTLGAVRAAEQPFPLPESWCWQRLGDIGFIYNGNSVSAADKENKYNLPNGLPYIATKDVGYGFDPLNYHSGVWIPESEEKFRIAPESTTLICSEGGSAGKKCGITDRPVCFGNKLFACECFGDFISEYLLIWYQTRAFFSAFSASMTGIIGGISLAKFVNLPIPIPPFAEQKRIAARVDALMSLVDALEAKTHDTAAAHETLVRELLLTLAHSQEADDIAANWSRIETRFDDLFTTQESVDALRNTAVQVALYPTPRLTRGRAVNIDHDHARTQKNWPTIPLGELLSFGPKNGLSPRAADFDSSVKSLTLTATTSGVFQGQHNKFVDIEPPPEDSELWLKSGDILIQRANALQYVGVSAIYDGEDNQFIYPDLMIKIRVSSELLPRFALLALNSSKVREYFKENATGTSGSMPKINHKTLKLAPIIVPPKSEQKRILEYVDQFDELSEQLKAEMHCIEKYKVKFATALVTSTV